MPGARFFRIAWFTPVLMSYVVVGILWVWIYNFDWGPVNAALRAVGLGGLAKAWLGNPNTALPALIAVTTWMWIGFNMVVLLAALHSLPKEVIEAAELDNCGWGQKLVYVILPLIWPTVLNLLVLSFIGKMKIFDLVWITTKGGPLWSTETVSTYVYKRAFEWSTFDLGYPSAIATVVVRHRARRIVLTLTDRAAPAQQAGVLSAMTKPLKHAAAAHPARRLHGVRGRAVRVGRDHVAAHDDGDHARPFRAADPILHWEKFPTRLVQLELQRLFQEFRDDRALGGRDPDGRRRDGGALPRALPLPAQPRDLFHAVLDHHLPAADHHHLAVPDPGAVRALQHACRAHAGLRRDPAAADDLHPGELLRPHPEPTCSTPRGWTAIRNGRSSGACSFPIALPAIATTVILNFILLWNEFLYAVVLITDDANRTLPLGIQRFMGDQLEDIGMIATGLMIAIVPVIIVYAFFSEKLIQGMTAGAVK